MKINHIYIALVMVFAFSLRSNAHKNPIAPADTTVDVQLTTNGTVTFVSTITETSKVALKKANAQNPADTLFKRVEDTDKNIKVVTNQINAGKSHGNTQVGVPEKYNLKFQTAIGNINLTDLEAKVRGTVKRGSITAIRVKGKIDVFTALGDISVTDSDASGLVMTKNGNVTLQDVRSDLTPIAQNGKITVVATKNYFGTQKATAMKMTYEQANLDIATVPEGGLFALGKGNIVVGSATKATELSTNEGNLTLNTASGGVRLRTQKGRAIVKIALNSTSKELIQIEAKDDDAELWIPRRFTGDFVISIEQNKNLAVSNRLMSDIIFSNVTSQQITDPKTKEVTNRQVHTNQKIGANGRPVRIKVFNGNVYIKYIN